MDFKLYLDLELEERVNQVEILKTHKKELRKRREMFFQNNLIYYIKYKACFVTELMKQYG